MTIDRRDPGTLRQGWPLALASAGALLTSLDVVAVATALSTIRDRLHAALSDLERTINGYNLVFACLMLTGAALGDRFGRRAAYLAGLLILTVAWPRRHCRRAWTR